MAGIQDIDEPCGSLAIAIDDEQLRRAHCQQRMGDRRAGATGSQQHHAREVGAGQLPLEAVRQELAGTRPASAG